MSARLSNAPVYYALAQAVFNPVAAMEKYVGEIQDRLRQVGYTLFEPHQVTHLKIPASGQPFSPEVVQEMSWLMVKKDRTAGFILTNSAIVFHTTHYVTRQEFIPELLRGLNAVHQVAQLEHVSRLGLRYLDAILPKKGETVEQYLVEGLRGIDLDCKKTRALNEYVFATETGPLVPQGTLVVRIYQAIGPLGYPADLQPRGLVQKKEFQINESRPHAVIDTDHFAEGQMELDFEAIEKQLFDLHGKIKQAFDKVVTDHAKSVWA